jgi:hypothetical protein
MIQKYGPGSEKLSDAQLRLLETEPGVSNVAVQAKSVRESLPASTNRKPRPHPGRQELPATWPRPPFRRGSSKRVWSAMGR